MTLAAPATDLAPRCRARRSSLCTPRSPGGLIHEYKPPHRTLNEFEHHYNRIARPFDWRFTSTDLHQLMLRLTSHAPQLDLAA
jgi:hypothetical protein